MPERAADNMIAAMMFRMCLVIAVCGCSSSAPAVRAPAPATPTVEPASARGFSASPVRHDFGSAAGEVRVVVTNGGTSSPGVLRTYSRVQGFSVTGDTCAGTELDPGASCEVTVAFDPAVATTADGTLEVRTDEQQLVVVPLRGVPRS